ncbi:MAG: SGNH/GDSL hydrolase family protein [Synechococcales bacterium]|nr:SGNH/GDSL hydrolase family protein [Synechococcales bacterium]
MKSVLLTIALLLLLALLLELVLRYGFGFGNPLLYQPDVEIGYLLLPNQSTRRFGNRIVINNYSMRGAAITAQRSPQTQRILVLGDSVVNGGWWTDQADTVSELLLRSLDSSRSAHPESEDFSGEVVVSTVPTIEILNASANSWGPRNQLAYLKRYGVFQAQAIVLVINTDDLFATAPTSLGVGQDPNYPDRKPWLALEEVLKRYVLPVPPPSAALQAAQAESGDRVGRNLEAIQAIAAIAQAHRADFLLILTPLLREIEAGPRPYEVESRDRLRQLTQNASLSYIDCLPSFAALSMPRSLYRDHIHLSPPGNQLLSNHIRQWWQDLSG